MMRLTWNEFDLAVSHIARACAGQGVTGVYGVPRGGLPLAVALSHHLGAPLVADAAAPGTLVLDDIHDTGRTLAPLLRGEGPPPLIWVWVTREAAPVGYGAVLTDIGPAWLLFPWEDAAKADQDRLSYEESRR